MGCNASSDVPATTTSTSKVRKDEVRRRKSSTSSSPKQEESREGFHGISAPSENSSSVRDLDRASIITPVAESNNGRVGTTATPGEPGQRSSVRNPLLTVTDPEGGKQDSKSNNSSQDNQSGKGSSSDRKLRQALAHSSSFDNLHSASDSPGKDTLALLRDGGHSGGDGDSSGISCPRPLPIHSRPASDAPAAAAVGSFQSTSDQTLSTVTQSFGDDRPDTSGEDESIEHGQPTSAPIDYGGGKPPLPPLSVNPSNNNSQALVKQVSSSSGKMVLNTLGTPPLTSNNNTNSSPCAAASVRLPEFSKQDFAESRNGPVALACTQGPGDNPNQPPERQPVMGQSTSHNTQTSAPGQQNTSFLSSQQQSTNATSIASWGKTSSVGGYSMAEPDQPDWWRPYVDHGEVARYAIDQRELDHHFQSPSNSLVHNVATWDGATQPQIRNAQQRSGSFTQQGNTSFQHASSFQQHQQHASTNSGTSGLLSHVSSGGGGGQNTSNSHSSPGGEAGSNSSPNSQGMGIQLVPAPPGAGTAAGANLGASGAAGGGGLGYFGGNGGLIGMTSASFNPMVANMASISMLPRDNIQALAQMQSVSVLPQPSGSAFPPAAGGGRNGSASSTSGSPRVASEQSSPLGPSLGADTGLENQVPNDRP